MVELTHAPLSLENASRAVADPAAGGIDIFLGVVRNKNLEKSVKYLEYEAYETMAKKQMQLIEEESRKKWKLLHVFMIHRLGKVEIGEASVILAVSSVHRPECFAATRYIIDRLKETVPIWKKEYFEGGAIWQENAEVKEWVKQS
ncbi:molybdenum cofactor biosynthesis protein MoaE [Candidatus Riflebacteria bacterium]